MSQAQRARRGETSIPPVGYDVIRSQGRYFPVCLHLEDRAHPGASAFHRPDGSVVSFARRLPAVLYLYQHGVQRNSTAENASHATCLSDVVRPPVSSSLASCFLEQAIGR